MDTMGGKHTRTPWYRPVSHDNNKITAVILDYSALFEILIFHKVVCVTDSLVIIVRVVPEVVCT